MATEEEFMADVRAARAGATKDSTKHQEAIGTQAQVAEIRQILAALVSIVRRKSNGALPAGIRGAYMKELDEQLRDSSGEECIVYRLSLEEKRVLIEKAGFRIGHSYRGSRVFFTVGELLLKCRLYGYTNESIKRWEARVSGISPDSSALVNDLRREILELREVNENLSKTITRLTEAVEKRSGELEQLKLAYIALQRNNARPT